METTGHYASSQRATGPCKEKPAQLHPQRRIACHVRLRRQKIRIGDSEVEIFRQESVLKHAADLDVVRALYIGEVGAQASIGQFSILIERRRGSAGNESCAIRKNIFARVVVELVVPPKPRS